MVQIIQSKFITNLHAHSTSAVERSEPFAVLGVHSGVLGLQRGLDHGVEHVDVSHVGGRVNGQALLAVLKSAQLLVLVARLEELGDLLGVAIEDGMDQGALEWWRRKPLFNILVG